MTIGELLLSDEVELAGWIRPRLGGRFGAVTRTLPRQYQAYARIFHPAKDRDGIPVTWPEVAALTGQRTHPLMQWHALVGSADPVNVTGSLWPGEDPQRGHLVPEVLRALTGVLAQHTTAPSSCAFCLWDGWGWLNGSAVNINAASSVSAVRATGEHPAPSARLGLPASSETPQPGPVSALVSSLQHLESDGPRVRLPGRDYLLLTGPVQAATRLGWWSTPWSFRAQSPNLFWPADQAWCVATEIDFDSTLVAGTQALIGALLDEPTLDAWPIHADDSLAADADQVNNAGRWSPRER